jgi:hypothetical protein
MYKYDLSATPHHYVWAPRQILRMEPIPNTKASKQMANY